LKFESLTLESHDPGIAASDRPSVGAIEKMKNLSSKYQPWIDARKRFHLSHAHIQMARELGLNPKKLGGLANHRQEPWKAPLPEFIAELYRKRFGKDRPDDVRPLEQIIADRVKGQS